MNSFEPLPFSFVSLGSPVYMDGAERRTLGGVIHTISYNYAADSLSELASINEAASIVGNSEDITYKLRNLFNAEM